MASASRPQDFYGAVRDANRAVWNGINNLLELQAEYNALDYGNTLVDGTGTNAGLTKTDLGAVIFDSANALKTVLNAGSATNMAKIL